MVASAKIGGGEPTDVILKRELHRLAYKAVLVVFKMRDPGQIFDCDMYEWILSRLVCKNVLRAMML